MVLFIMLVVCLPKPIHFLSGMSKDGKQQQIDRFSNFHVRHHTAKLQRKKTLLAVFYDCCCPNLIPFDNELSFFLQPACRKLMLSPPPPPPLPNAGNHISEELSASDFSRESFPPDSPRCFPPSSARTSLISKPGSIFVVQCVSWSDTIPHDKYTTNLKTLTSLVE